MSIDFFVPGKPQGKERARSSRKTGKHYTPDKTRSYEQAISIYAKNAMMGLRPLSAPIYLKLEIIMPIPNGWPKWKIKKAMAGEVLPTTNPDADNVEKSIKDACNKIVWGDDSYVVKCDKVKKYVSDERSLPGVHVHINVLNGMCAQLAKNKVNQ